MSLEQVLFSILFFHLIFDFALQTDKQAKEKSTNFNQLLYHVNTYSVCWACVILVMTNFNWLDTLIFTIATYFSHLLTDAISSNVGKKYWDEKDTHTGFLVVGIDQAAHFIQLFLTFKFIGLC